MDNQFNNVYFSNDHQQIGSEKQFLTMSSTEKGVGAGAAVGNHGGLSVLQDAFMGCSSEASGQGEVERPLSQQQTGSNRTIPMNQKYSNMHQEQ